MKSCISLYSYWNLVIAKKMNHYQVIDTIKALGEKYNFASNMKEYKANPENYAGSVADVSGFLRLAVTGKNSSPDMYAVMGILGKEKVVERLNSYAAEIVK